MLRGDLETIILKTLTKDRQGRYQSAGQLADDIKRHLDGEPIEARPLSAWNRVLRQIARHPLIATTCAAFFVAVCIIATAATFTWWYTNVPYRIDFIPSTRDVRLLTAAGISLYVWGIGRWSCHYPSFASRTAIAVRE
jgi:hypothetical protein